MLVWQCVPACDSDEISDERRVHVQILDGAERLQVIVVAIAWKNLFTRDRNTCELDLGVLDLGNEWRRRRPDREVWGRHGNVNDHETVSLRGRIGAAAGDHEKRAGVICAGRPLLVPGQHEPARCVRLLVESRADGTRMIAFGFGRAQGADSVESRNQEPERFRVAGCEREPQAICLRTREQRAINRRDGNRVSRGRGRGPPRVEMVGHGRRLSCDRQELIEHGASVPRMHRVQASHQGAHHLKRGDGVVTVRRQAW